MEDDNQLKKCPFCGEEINVNAKKCKFCKNWLDEEILCPFCSEKIKKSAKKCRHCGEWLEAKKNKSKSQIDTSSDKDFKFEFTPKIKIAVGVIITLLVVFLTAYGISTCYIPSCSSKTIENRLIEHLKMNYSALGGATISENKVVSKNQRGYTCIAELQGETEEGSVPFIVKYTYEKSGINTYNYTSNLVLQDCYSDMIQNLVVDLIRQIKSPTFIEDVEDISLEYATLKKYDEKNKSYSCQATAVMEAKPGKAISLHWYNDSAKTKVKCAVDYKSAFCGNGITTCAHLQDIYNCKYEED